jgi:asparagine synthase (glutamine-hydrolysing)
MCGFAVIHHHASSEEVGELTLNAMRETLAHRGPDGTGCWIAPDRRTGMSFCRLAIIDLAGGQQPMTSADGSLALVCNGEIYNHRDLRRELERDGAAFASECDVEVILHLYERHGEELVDHLDGMFAFVLWDQRRRRLIAARDRVGEKPLYFTDVGGRLMLASEIKALLAHPAVTAEVDRDAVDAYFTHLAVQAPATLFRGISKLPPGGLLVAEDGLMRCRRYWSVANMRAWREADRDEATTAVRALLRRSVESRLIADVPVGTLLSGGLDSTALVALATEAGARMRTFSVGFEHTRGSDEREDARRIAREFGCDHHEVEVSEQDVLDFLPELIHYQDEPLADPVCIPLSFVCGLARSTGTPVVLAGEGADELFWGYTGYARQWRRWPLIRSSLALPGPARTAMRALACTIEHPYLHELAHGIERRSLAPMHVPTGLSHELRQRMLAVDSAWLGGWQSSEAAAGARSKERKKALAFDTQEHEFELRLPELLLMRIDRFSMRHGVEARVPFLAPELVEYCYRLNPALKLAHGVSKSVMRDALRGIVPDHTLERRKQGFGAPADAWISSRLGLVLDSLLAREELRPYLNVDALRARLQLQLQGRGGAFRRNAYWLWPVLNFALWHYHWIEGHALEPLVAERARAII